MNIALIVLGLLCVIAAAGFAVLAARSEEDDSGP